MANVYFDSTMTDDERRRLLYAGDIFVYRPSQATRELVDLAQSMLDAAFAPLDPELAQHSLPVGEFAGRLAVLKPQFIHHPECKRLLPKILDSLGCSLERTYFDVPRLRTSTSSDYLTTGIAYAFHPHRDTWYSAPLCQINWWIPVSVPRSDNCLAFHPRYFAAGVKNSSETYNYQEWNKSSRFSAAGQIGTDTRVQPKALESVEMQPDLRLLPPPGGIILFSAAQLHSSVPNTSGRTRLSIDFRTVHLEDAEQLRGARNVDSRCTGTTMQDYLRGTDLEHLPASAQKPYETGPQPPQRGF